MYVTVKDTDAGHKNDFFCNRKLQAPSRGIKELDTLLVPLRALNS